MTGHLVPSAASVPGATSSGGRVGRLLPGPLRSARPRRVLAVATADGQEEAARVRHALRSLRRGPWWPPLGELLEAARRFYAGGLAETGAPLATPAG